MTDWKDILRSRAFWLQAAGSVFLAMFEIGLTGSVEWWVVGMIVYVNAARLYISVETPLLARDDEFEAEGLKENVIWLNVLNVAYIAAVIFLYHIFVGLGWDLGLVEPTYLLLLFFMAGFAHYCVMRLKEKRDAHQPRNDEQVSEQVSGLSAQLLTKDAQIKELNEQICAKDEQIGKLSAHKGSGDEQLLRTIEQKQKQLDQALRKSEQWDMISEQLGKVVRENGRYYIYTFKNGELSREKCNADGTKKKVNGSRVLI